MYAHTCTRKGMANASAALLCLGLQIVTPPAALTAATQAPVTPTGARGSPARPSHVRASDPPAPITPDTTVEVWEGQSMQCRLVLTNPTNSPSLLSVTTARVVILNAKVRARSQGGQRGRCVCTGEAFKGHAPSQGWAGFGVCSAIAVSLWSLESAAAVFEGGRGGACPRSQA